MQVLQNLLMLPRLRDIAHALSGSHDALVAHTADPIHCTREARSPKRSRAPSRGNQRREFGTIDVADLFPTVASHAAMKQPRNRVPRCGALRFVAGISVGPGGVEPPTSRLSAGQRRQRSTAFTPQKH
jgi:hypothetical protein